MIQNADCLKPAQTSQARLQPNRSFHHASSPIVSKSHSRWRSPRARPSTEQTCRLIAIRKALGGGGGGVVGSTIVSAITSGGGGRSSSEEGMTPRMGIAKGVTPSGSPSHKGCAMWLFIRLLQRVGTVSPGETGPRGLRTLP